jgi:dTMP kinase
MKFLHRQRARFIVLEGIDGSGKTALSAQIANALTSRGLKVVQTHQPTKLPSGQSARRIARSDRSSERLSNALLRDRRTHYYLTLLPAFRSADVIICDRYFYSTVYQSKNVRDLKRRVAFYRRALPIPDITFLLLPSVMIARQRITSSGRKIDVFEGRLSAYRALYSNLRGYPEVVLCTKKLSLRCLTNFCVTKILAECGAIQNKARD